MYLAGNSGNELQVAQFIFQFRTQSAHLAHAHSPAMSLFSRPKGRPKMCNLKINCAIHWFFFALLNAYSWAIFALHFVDSGKNVDGTEHRFWLGVIFLETLRNWCLRNQCGTNAKMPLYISVGMQFIYLFVCVVKRSKQFNFQAWNDISTMGLKRTWIKNAGHGLPIMQH